MSPQRSRMIEDMIPAWLAGGTQQLYVQGCAGWPLPEPVLDDLKPSVAYPSQPGLVDSQPLRRRAPQ
jgi:hypothetical protein